MLNSAPHEWTIEQIADYVCAHGDNGERPRRADWLRPYGFYSMRSRLRLAWAVFTGRADALFWPGQMPKAY